VGCCRAGAGAGGGAAGAGAAGAVCCAGNGTTVGMGAEPMIQAVAAARCVGAVSQDRGAVAAAVGCAGDVATWICSSLPGPLLFKLYGDDAKCTGLEAGTCCCFTRFRREGEEMAMAGVAPPQTTTLQRSEVTSEVEVGRAWPLSRLKTPAPHPPIGNGEQGECGSIGGLPVPPERSTVASRLFAAKSINDGEGLAEIEIGVAQGKSGVESA
jgi:hypothetical protein